MLFMHKPQIHDKNSSLRRTYQACFFIVFVLVRFVLCTLTFHFPQLNKLYSLLSDRNICQNHTLFIIDSFAYSFISFRIMMYLSNEFDNMFRDFGFHFRPLT